MVDIAPHKLN